MHLDKPLVGREQNVCGGVEWVGGECYRRMLVEQEYVRPGSVVSAESAVGAPVWMLVWTLSRFTVFLLRINFLFFMSILLFVLPVHRIKQPLCHLFFARHLNILSSPEGPIERMLSPTQAPICWLGNRRCSPVEVSHKKTFWL
jgi:hypothetical protein